MMLKFLDISRKICFDGGRQNPKVDYRLRPGDFFMDETFPETPRYREGGGASFGALTGLGIFVFAGS